MAYIQNNKNPAPEVSITTFFSSIDDNSLVELIVWNGKLGFKFKRLGRTVDGKYDRDTTKSVNIYPKTASISGISELMDNVIRERREAFAKGDSYKEFDRYFETVNERYDSKTGEKIINSNFKITTMKDAAGIDRVTLVGQNSNDTIEVMLSEKDSTVDFQAPANLVIDKFDIQLYRFGLIMRQLCSNSSVMTWYNMGKTFADYTIKQILIAFGKYQSPNNSANNVIDSLNNAANYSNHNNSDGFIEDEDAPF